MDFVCFLAANFSDFCLVVGAVRMPCEPFHFSNDAWLTCFLKAFASPILAPAMILNKPLFWPKSDMFMYVSCVLYAQKEKCGFLSILEDESQKYCCTFKPNEVLYFSVEHKENILNLKVGQVLPSGGVVLEMIKNPRYIKRPLKIFYNGEIVHWYNYLRSRTLEAHEYLKKIHKPEGFIFASHVHHLAARIDIKELHSSKCKFIDAPFCCKGMIPFAEEIERCRDYARISEEECDKIFSFYHMYYEWDG